ncbi:vWA domain-containing protein [Methanocaldococcus fervens]|uniref:von Willebrand factor type A n=1 Tax=Methanocaldococcus fervens (strain DSM 4213 / JCM 15782 / AG86) TaxID=573064 RepID=C7P8V3_METFA|nr:VWA domain-containing protein [Methanocaldococcus fervens]ACV24985.1 von Willebrand factor type A [Methanocaldococcus fervens AG86]
MKNVIKHDAYDKKAFERFLKNSKYLQKLLRYYSQFHPIHEKLAEDTFYAFFKYVVEFNEYVEERFKINKAILEGAMKNIEYEKSKLFTELDEMNAGTATIMFCEKFFENLKLKNLNKELKKFISDGNGEGLEDKLKETAKETMKEISEEVSEVLQGFDAVENFGKGLGDKKLLSPEDRIKLADKILENKKIREIVKKLGKLKLLATNEYKSKIKHYSGEVYSTKIGRDLKHLLPKEIVNLSDELLYYDFLRRFADKKLMIYDIQNKLDKQKGPIVVLLDHSGSMYGDREIWGKAVALSLIEIAKRENRELYYIAFDDGVRFEKLINPKNITMEEIIEIASLYFGGGTNFIEPLNKAMEVIKKNESFKNADILLITDGYAEVNDMFLKEFDKFKNEHNVKLISVFVEIFPTETLKMISDEVIKVYDLVEEEARKIYRAVS